MDLTSCTRDAFIAKWSFCKASMKSVFRKASVYIICKSSSEVVTALCNYPAGKNAYWTVTILVGFLFQLAEYSLKGLTEAHKVVACTIQLEYTQYTCGTR